MKKKIAVKATVEKKPASKKPSALVSSISSIERLETMLKEAENELAALQPKIDKLESQLSKLGELKQTKQKLITLKLSIQSILNNFSETENINFPTSKSLAGKSTFSEKGIGNFKPLNLTTSSETSNYNATSFLPSLAFEAADKILKQKTSLNYELFRAIVLKGGQASTQQIKQFLLDHRITQPGSGQGFDEVPLTDISSRVNYLIRKGLVASEGRGVFKSLLGWEE